jgi:thymidylate kinase
MFVNILGGDGCGKTTQIELLTEWARQEMDVPARRMAKRDIFDPDGVPECDFFRIPYETLAHDFLPRMREESRALWLIYMNAVLIRALPPRADELVLHDGYWQKHYATEAAMGLPTEWLLAVCAFFPEPDLTFVLDIDPRAVVARGHHHQPYESGCDWSCSDAAFIDHQDKVRCHLLALAAARKYVVVDAHRSVDDLFVDLAGRLAPHLERMILVPRVAQRRQT